jgi:hypothetical protein
MIQKEYKCECGRIFEKPQSLNSHFSRCIVHRKGKPPEPRNHGGGWNKGLNVHTSQSVLKNSISIKGKCGRKWSEKDRIAHSILMKGKSGGYREGSNKWKGIFIEKKDGSKVWLDSSYEYRFILILEKFKIDWDKNFDKFPYEFNGQSKNYIPDFYIKEINLWVETKGMLKEEDPYKWESFIFPLSIIKKNDLIFLEKIESKSELILYLYSRLWKKPN